MFLDRTAVLFLGIAVGGVMTSAFYGGGGGPAEAAALSPANPAKMANAAGASAATCRDRFQPTPDLMRAAIGGKEIQIGVLGDSFGDGLWAGLYNELRADPQFAVHRFAKQSTGFTRYSSLNLLDDARSKLDEQPVDIAVVSFGANDTFDIWEEGQLMPYMGEDWQRVIGGRVRAYVGELRDRDIEVVWVGLPRMREAEFDNKITQMNAFNSGLMCELGVPFIDTAPVSTGSDGGYSEMLPRSGGRPIKARAEDGVHMSMTGYRILLEGVAADLRTMIGVEPAEDEAASDADA